MKKLMFAALGAAVTSGAFAAPLVYDYKASAKHMYLKEVNIRVGAASVPVYQKYLKTASLKGYLIQDTDGATSQAIVTDMLTNPNIAARCFNGTGATGTDFGRNRAFLVVMNTKAERAVRAPKIIPAILDAKWLDTRLNADGVFSRSSGVAEGYLWAGGDFSANAGNVRPGLDMLYVPGSTRNTQPTESRKAGALANVNMVGDYAWTSLWLFGQYNMPTGLTGLWDASQAIIDAAEPIPTAFAPGAFFFHDAWLNGAGFGKYSIGSVARPCCGYPSASQTPVLETLSGNLKGGLYLCTENGTFFNAGVYAHLAGDIWEDQFFCARLSGANTAASWAAGDAEGQQDLWQDGELELNTTDCISGNWSIKRLSDSKLERLMRDVELEYDEVVALQPAVAGPDRFFEDAPGLEDLLTTIKAAAEDLDDDVLFANGDEIFNYDDRVFGGLDEVPFITPAFARYYGLANFR